VIKSIDNLLEKQNSIGVPTFWKGGGKGNTWTWKNIEEKQGRVWAKTDIGAPKAFLRVGRKTEEGKVKSKQRGRSRSERRKTNDTGEEGDSDEAGKRNPREIGEYGLNLQLAMIPRSCKMNEVPNCEKHGMYLIVVENIEEGEELIVPGEDTTKRKENRKSKRDKDMREWKNNLLKYKQKMKEIRGFLEETMERQAVRQKKRSGGYVGKKMDTRERVPRHKNEVKLQNGERKKQDEDGTESWLPRVKNIQKVQFDLVYQEEVQHMAAPKERANIPFPNMEYRKRNIWKPRTEENMMHSPDNSWETAWMELSWEEEAKSPAEEKYHARVNKTVQDMMRKRLKMENEQYNVATLLAEYVGDVFAEPKEELRRYKRSVRRMCLLVMNEINQAIDEGWSGEVMETLSNFVGDAARTPDEEVEVAEEKRRTEKADKLGGNPRGSND
jgi:hypothetical protein